MHFSSVANFRVATNDEMFASLTRMLTDAHCAAHAWVHQFSDVRLTALCPQNGLHGGEVRLNQCSRILDYVESLTVRRNFQNMVLMKKGSYEVEVFWNTIFYKNWTEFKKSRFWVKNFKHNYIMMLCAVPDLARAFKIDKLCFNSCASTSFEVWDWKTSPRTPHTQKAAYGAP